MEPIRVAAVQMAPRWGEPERNLEKILDWMQEAARMRAHLVVFPELSNAGYLLDDVAQARETAVEVPGPFTDRIAEAARELGLYVAVGVSELGDDGHLFNSALLFDSQGELIGHYQKQFLHGHDKNWFQVGGHGHPVMETPFGRVGMYICADGRIPEPNRLLALGGARLLLNLTNWGSADQYLLHVPTRTVENEAWTVAADRVGAEKGFHFLGHSFVMGPDGQKLAQAGSTEEEVIWADIPAEALFLQTGRPDGLLAGRRPETYNLLTVPYDETPAARFAAEPVVPASMSVTLIPIQTNGKGGGPDQVLDRALRMAHAGVQYGGRILVLPELFPFALPLRVAPADAAATSRRVLERFGEHLRQWKAFAALSLVEQEGSHFYHTTYLLGPEGLVGRYRKTHLAAGERVWATPGQTYAVFALPWGNVGILTGREILYFEVARILALSGADLILVPSSWESPCEVDWACRERALENRVFLAAANRVDAPVSGRSMVVWPTSWVQSQCGAQEEQAVRAHVNLALARDKSLGPVTHVLKDRQVHHYGPLVRRGLPPREPDGRGAA